MKVGDMSLTSHRYYTGASKDKYARYYFIARNKDNKLFLYSNPPIKGSKSWAVQRGMYFMQIDYRTFLNVKWEDERPTRITMEEK